ncbi:MAG: DUF1566 domain-containing protein [Deltaproteobacteria bacterium]|nr:DUF1566 domain-containing protein [Deltaproteobacteria bacterium]
MRYDTHVPPIGGYEEDMPQKESRYFLLLLLTIVATGCSGNKCPTAPFAADETGPHATDEKKVSANIAAVDAAIVEEEEYLSCNMQDKLMHIRSDLIKKKNKYQVAPKLFRSTPKEVTESEIVSFVKSENMYDRHLNKQGCYINYFADIMLRDEVTKEEICVSYDFSTNLIWKRWIEFGDENGLNYKQASEYLKTLNNNRYAHIDTWRFPTLEEAYTLLKEKFNRLAIEGTILSSKGYWFWSSDRIDKNHVVSFSGAYGTFITSYPSNHNPGVLAVSTATDKAKTWIISEHRKQKSRIDRLSYGNEQKQRCTHWELYDLMPQFIKKPREKNPAFNRRLKLRTKPTVLTEDSIRAILRSPFWGAGKSCLICVYCFANDFVLTAENTIEDRVTDLIWKRAATDNMTYVEANAYIEGLNASNKDTKHPWRLPTVEEAFSIGTNLDDDLVNLKKLINRDSSLHPLFDEKTRFTWTSDSFFDQKFTQKNYPWAVGLHGAYYTARVPSVQKFKKNKYQVLPVKSAK